MSSANRNGNILITHYINPHMFWFRYESDFITNEPLSQLEASLNTYSIELSKRKAQQGGYKAKIGEIVMVLHLGWQKWIRAHVDQIFEFYDGHRYYMWAIDHG